jgi:hypothetical protein
MVLSFAQRQFIKSIAIGFLITFIFIRFSKEMLNIWNQLLFGALIIGANKQLVTRGYIIHKASKLENSH